MARDSKEQKELKIRALNEAVEVLKEESSPMNNKVTFDKVVYLANELYSEELTRKISPTSIITPPTKYHKNQAA